MIIIPICGSAAVCKDKELLDSIFGHRSMLLDVRERFIHSLAYTPSRTQVALPLARRPHRFETLGQVGGRHHLDPEPANQLARASIDPGHIGDSISW